MKMSFAVAVVMCLFVAIDWFFGEALLGSQAARTAWLVFSIPVAFLCLMAFISDMLK